MVEPAGRPDYARPGSDVVVVRVASDGGLTMVEEKPEVWLTGNEVAAMLNMPAASFRNYVAIGRAPKADDPDAESPQNRRRPRWLKSSIDEWRDSPRERAIRRRRGRGKGKRQSE